jgi:hypothetical protein
MYIYHSLIYIYHSYIIHQELHRSWKKYLKQYYVQMRNGHDEAKVRISNSRWRNYGVGEIWDETTEQFTVISHPGGVWVRYSNDPKEPPQRLDLRRNCMPRNRYLMPITATAMLPPLRKKPLPISDATFVLYPDCLPLPITKEKKRDLRALSKQLKAHKRHQYTFKEAGPDDETDDEQYTDDEQRDVEPEEQSDEPDDEDGGHMPDAPLV